MLGYKKAMCSGKRNLNDPSFVGHMNIILPRKWEVLNVHLKIQFDRYLLSIHYMKELGFAWRVTKIKAMWPLKTCVQKLPD